MGLNNFDENQQFMLINNLINKLNSRGVYELDNSLKALEKHELFSELRLVFPTNFSADEFITQMNKENVFHELVSAVQHTFGVPLDSIKARVSGPILSDAMRSTLEDIISAQSFEYWERLTFGMYVGKTLPEIVFEDPDWFFWGLEENIFPIGQPLRNQALEILYKTKFVKIPPLYGESRLAAYHFHEGNMFFSHIEFPTKRSIDPADDESSVIMDVLDFGLIRSRQKFAKGSYSKFL